MDLRTLSRHFRITAFVDVLGWGALTEGIDSLTLRRMAREGSLTQAERETAEELQKRIGIASRIDAAVREILRALEDFAIPREAVGGDPGAAHFWQNQHVTFVRASDSIFLHSSSYRGIVAVVSELVKRGLEHGILFRGGISCGVVVHLGGTNPSHLDPRSRDISLFGDGITSAVAAEKAGAGCGVRVMVHSRLTSLLTPEDNAVMDARATENPDIREELCWWRDLADMWPGTRLTDKCTLATPEWLSASIDRLDQHTDFGWNRESEKGRGRLADTFAVLQAALDALGH